jgi:hypothetical protein
MAKYFSDYFKNKKGPREVFPGAGAIFRPKKGGADTSADLGPGNTMRLRGLICDFKETQLIGL